MSSSSRSPISPIAASILLQAAIARTQRALRAVYALRAAAIGVGAGIVSVLITLLVARRMPVPELAMALLVVVAVIVAALLIYAPVARLDAVRTALWIEERMPAGFALVTFAEQSPAGSDPVPELDALRERLAHAGLDAVGGSARADERLRAAVGQWRRERLGGPTLFLLVALLLAGWVLMSARTTRSPLAARAVDETHGATSREGVATQPIGAWSVRVEPPAYSGRSVQALGNVESVRALAGSRLVIEGSGGAPATVEASVSNGVAARSALRPEPATAPATSTENTDTGWRVSMRATGVPTVLRISRDSLSRLLLVDGYVDSLPRVSLLVPARDSVLRRASGRFPLEATVHDDLGIASASFELIVSSGEGEQFTARTVRLGMQRLGRAPDARLRLALDLDSLRLGPGDIVHMRAVARDGHPDSTREWGSSETRSIRVARLSEYDSTAVEAAPPPEIDKSLMSQRMLLLLTEKLQLRRPRLAIGVVAAESRALARDQARLRLAVGDAVFQRLSGESGAEHSHSVGDGHDHGVDLVGGKLTLAVGGVNANGMLEEGDDSPVIGINTPLLEAYNAMWDAGRALEQVDPRAAIPHMRVALAAIERARAASRLYLRGKPPVVILDLAKIRLTGKDTGVSNQRSTRAAIPPIAALRESRLLHAASLAVLAPDAARDSIAVLRLDVLADNDAVAVALSNVLQALRRGGDVTAEFVRARRAIGGVKRDAGSEWSRLAPP